LFAALLAKKTQHKKESKQIEYKCKLEGISQKIINNTNLSLEILEKTSKIWNAALKDNHDFQGAIGDFMRDNKNLYETLQTNQALIEIGINDFRKDAGTNLNTSDILMELYTVYKNAYQLNGNKNLSLEALDSQIHDLKSDFKTLVKNLKIYLPDLQTCELTDKTTLSSSNIEITKNMPSEPTDDQLALTGSTPGAEEASIPEQTINAFPDHSDSQTILPGEPQSDTQKAEINKIARINSSVDIKQSEPLPETTNQAPQINPADEAAKFKMLSSNMGFTQVERLLGVPLVKNKLLKNKEVWHYPSLKSGFQHQVFFVDTKFLKWKHVALKTNRE